MTALQRVADSFAAQASARPDAVAVVCAGQALTYEQLDRRANQVARELGRRGAGRGSLVVIALERSAELIVAVLGAQRSGAAYVPVDLSYPAEGIALILEDADPAVIVTQAPLTAALPATAADLLRLDADAAAIASHDAAPPAMASGLDDLAYVIFTSGSTGRPKGVMLHHRGLANLMATMAASPGLSAGETMLGVTTPAFDLSVPDLYLPLTTGATLLLATRDEAANPASLAELIAEHRVSLMQATPSTWRMLLDHGWGGSTRLRAVAGGEAVPQALADELHARTAEVWNFYGPTEATVWTTAARLRPGEPVTIGAELPGMRCEILGEDGEPVTGGSPGELVIGGVQVARGYLGRPELTAERFVADPSAPGETRYRTGDQARRLSGGDLEFLGRLDHQVKLRGFRIELGEIEAALAQDPGVQDAVVVLRPDPRGAPQLVGYVVPRAGAVLASGPLRRGLQARLPAYMVPAAIVSLAALPLTPNGKIDRDALPAADFAQDAATTARAVAPRSDLERELVGIWEDVTGIRPIGVTDDFFELGIDSLTAARLVTRIEARFEEKLPLGPMFQAPTIEELAELLASTDTGRRWSSLVPMRTDGGRPPIFCIHGGAGTVLFYEAFERRLGADQPVYALQAAGLLGDQAPDQTVEEMAERYVGEILEARPDGPYVLAGYCFGGLVAFEMARRLRARGADVPLTIMLNAPAGSYNRRYNPVFAADGAMTDEHGDLLPDFRPRVQPGLLEAVRRHRSPGTIVRAGTRRVRWIARRRLSEARFQYHLRSRRPLPDDLREAASFQRIARRAQNAYEPTGFDGQVLVVSAEPLYREPDLGWSDHAGGGVVTFQVPGAQRVPRDTMDEPVVALVAARVTAEIDALLPPQRTPEPAGAPGRDVAKRLAGLTAEQRAALKRRRARRAPDRIPRRGEPGPAVLSFPQQRLWFLEQFAPGRPTYNAAIAMRVAGPLDVERLRQALAVVVERHEVLRTLYVEGSAGPRQVVLDEWTVELPTVDLTDVGAGGREPEMLRLARVAARRPFDLTRDLMVRATVFRLGEEQHALVLEEHHIAFDGWSDAQLFSELEEVYAALGEGRAPRLPELPVQYADFAVWQRERLRGERRERHLAYWREALGGGQPPIALPVDFARPAVQQFEGAHHHFDLPAGLGGRVRALAREERCTPFMVLLASFAAVLQRWSGADDVSLGSPIANRSQSEVEHLIGFFSNTLVLRVQTSGDPSFRDLVGRARAMVLGALEHQDLPFEELVADLRPPRDPRLNPLFQVNFRVQSQPAARLRLPDADIEPFDLDLGFARFDLALELQLEPDRFRGYVEYNLALFRRVTAVNLAEHFEALLADALARPDIRLSELAFDRPVRERVTGIRGSRGRD